MLKRVVHEPERLTELPRGRGHLECELRHLQTQCLLLVVHDVLHRLLVVDEIIDRVLKHLGDPSEQGPSVLSNTFATYLATCVSWTAAWRA